MDQEINEAEAGSGDQETSIPTRRTSKSRWRSKALVQRLATISVKCLAREPKSRWLPIVEQTLMTDILFGADERYYLSQFRNLMEDKRAHKASEMATALRFKLLKINLETVRIPKVEPHKPMIKSGIANPNGESYTGFAHLLPAEWPLIRLKGKKTRSSVFSYYKTARWSIGIDASRRLKVARKESLNIVELPPLGLGDGADPSDELAAIDALAVDHAHPELIYSLAKQADSMDALAAKCIQDLELSDEQQVLLISSFDQVTNEGLTEYLKERGIDPQVGFRALANKRKKVIKLTVEWRAKNAAKAADIHDCVRRFGAMRDELWGSNPYLGEAEKDRNQTSSSAETNTTTEKPSNLAERRSATEIGGSIGAPSNEDMT